MHREDILVQNWQYVQASLNAACERVRRNPKEITLLAVTKYALDKDVLTLLTKGLLTDIGESRVQQAWARWHENPQFARFTNVKKHFIGHLQKNKAAKAALLFDYIDSLDDLETAQILSTHVPANKVLHVLVQVKLTDRVTQSGLPLPEARRLCAQLKGAFNNIAPSGYMAVAPRGETPETLRQLFRQLKKVFDEDFKNSPHAQLSLGMSEDFITAVEEGSTLPRIGSLLFAKNLEGI